jgi:hypothetical protein
MYQALSRTAGHPMNLCSEKVTSSSLIHAMIHDTTVGRSINNAGNSNWLQHVIRNWFDRTGVFDY